jgi:DNA-binding LacI/PurR family transcriptional regulator
MGKSITIQDVAERAEVSTGTVSRVLNGPGGAPETRRRVLEAAAELNYRANLFARGMRGGRKNCIGILVEGHISPEDPWLETIVLSMAQVVSESGYHCMIDFFRPDEEVFPRMLENVDACMLLGNYREDFFTEVATHSGLPLVTYDEKMPYENGESLFIDWKAGMQEAIGYLLALEHSRLGLVVAGVEYPALRERYEGYLEGLPHYGREVDQQLIKTTSEMEDGGFEEAFQLTEELIDEQTDVSAIIYGSDCMAVAGMQKLREMSLQVPEDVSVVGFDDSALARVTMPPLTTVGVNYRDLCTRMLESVRMLLGERGSVPSSRIEPDLVRRSSTARRGMAAEL